MGLRLLVSAPNHFRVNEISGTRYAAETEVAKCFRAKRRRAIFSRFEPLTPHCQDLLLYLTKRARCVKFKKRRTTICSSHYARQFFKPHEQLLARGISRPSWQHRRLATLRCILFVLFFFFLFCTEARLNRGRVSCTTFLDFSICGFMTLPHTSNCWHRLIALFFRSLNLERLKKFTPVDNYTLGYARK